MFLSKLIKTPSDRSIVKNIELDFERLENTLNNSTAFMEFHELKNLKKIKYSKIEEIELKKNKHIKMFKYIIDVRITSTNISYHATHIDGKIIASKTKNQILPVELQTLKMKPNTIKTNLYYLLKALRKEIKKKIKYKSPIIIHIYDFRKQHIKQIIKNLSSYYEIKAIVLTNNNPHNGCRPSKIRTKSRLKFNQISLKRLNKKGYKF